MGYALINPKMLSWSRTREGLSVHEIARKFNKSEEQIIDWEDGKIALTFGQAQNWAKYTNTAFGFLFLKTPPPVDEIPIPDRRTVSGLNKIISPELRLTLNDVLYKQQWYKSYLEKNNIRINPVFGLFSINDGINAVVMDIRKHIKVDIPPKKGNWEDLFRVLVFKIEDIGILVMRNGVVKNKTTKPLSVKDFRGFCIYDELAPVIFINTNDSKSAQLFTLIHELSHLWINSSSLSNLEELNHDKEELFCNQVASEFLVPSYIFESEWKKVKNNWVERISELVSIFRVSRWVIARKALTLNLISYTEYNDYVSKLNEKKESKGQADYNTVQKVRVSPTLAKAVASEALSGRMLLRDAQSLIGIKPSKLANFAKKELNF